MSLFKKRPVPQPPRQAVSNPYTDQWFESWWGSIMTAGGVSADDPQNRFQLVMFTHKLLDDAARDYFSQLGDSAADRAYRQLVAGSSVTLQQKTAFLIQWNPQVPGLLKEKFTNFKGILTKAGQQHGRFRFYSSQCCGEPLEFDLQSAAASCSACGRPGAPS